MFLTSSTGMLFLLCAFARNCLILPSGQIIWAGKTSFIPAAAKEARGYAFGICGSAGEGADSQRLCQASCTLAGKAPRRHKAVPGPPLEGRKERGPTAEGQPGWVSPGGCPSAGRTVGRRRTLDLGRDTGTSTFNQIILIFKQQH